MVEPQSVAGGVAVVERATVKLAEEWTAAVSFQRIRDKLDRCCTNAGRAIAVTSRIGSLEFVRGRIV